MDLMRTLLIYMSATMTLAVQSTSAPKETPAPTPTPTAVVETAETPAPEDPAVTVTPSPTPAGERMTPLPVPLITPNTRAYHNLAMGAKGKEVRRLQEKLIEMGYLPEGAADGAYGRQTYNAIKKFQYYNGLTADGIAGRRTQTNLFENPDIAPNPETAPTEAQTAELTAEPTEAPTPEPTAEPTEVPTPEPTAEPTEAPTEAPTPEPTEAPTAEPTAEPTEAPTAEPTSAPTEEPAESTVPAVSTEPPAVTPEADIPEVIENLDLDAEAYEPLNGLIAMNEGNGPLEFVTMEDGVPVTARPRMSRSGSSIRVSLDDLCLCLEGWRLTDDGVGSVVLEAAGYILVLYNEDKGCSATLDGAEIPMKEEDFDFISEGHFINADFLAEALKGESAWDEEEQTLMLRIRDKDTGESGD